MILKRRIPQIYSRAELISDAVVHVSGITLALIAAPILVTLATVWIGEAWAVTSTLVYAISLVTMLICSALYNMLQNPRWTDRLRRIDQSAIYMKIAGTYTPFLILTSTKAGWILAAIWGVAVAGTSLLVLARSHLYVSIALYLGLGWIGVVFYGPALSGVSAGGLTLLLVSGILYSSGIVFLVWQRLPFHNTIWHVFVLCATGAAYAAVMVELVRAAS
ncbi:MAG: hemolysin III family protein [Pseudomonadota bacterium]